jgi:WD40 repeat protein
MSATSPQPRTFRAFISYRHLDNRREGRRWAEWLQRFLESYRVPESLRQQRSKAGQELPPSLYPVFRDEEELTPGGQLGEAIEKALQRSDWLIVLCSPRSANSPWVNAEIRRFQELGKGHRIIPVLIDGEPNAAPTVQSASEPAAPEECLPEALCFLPQVPGPVDGPSPGQSALRSFLGSLAADFRPEGVSGQGYTSAAAYRAALERENAAAPPQNQRSRATLRAMEVMYVERLNRMQLKICAGILGVDLGELTVRDAEARARRARTVAILASSVALVLVGLLVWALVAQAEARRRGFISLARALAAEAPRLQGQERMDEVAALLSRQAYLFNERNEGEALAQVDAALRSVLAVSNFSLLHSGVGGAYNAVAGTTNGWRLVHGSPNRTAGTWDWNPRHQPTPNRTAFREKGPAFVASAISGDGNTRIVATESGQLWNLASSSPGSADRTLPTLGGTATRLGLDGPGRLLAAGTYSGELTLVRLDAEPPSVQSVPDSGQATALAFSPDGASLAWGTVDGKVRWIPTTWSRAQPTAPEQLVALGSNVLISAVAYGPGNRLAVSGWARQPFRIDDDPHQAVTKRDRANPAMHALRIIDANTGETRVDLGPVDYWANALAFSPTGQYLAAGTTRGDARVWDFKNPTHPPIVIEGHRGEVNAIAWMPDERSVASMDIYGNFRVSRVVPPLVSPSLPLANAVVVLAVDPGTEQVLLVESGGAMSQWDPESGTFHQPPASSWDTKAAAFSASGRVVALAAGHGNPGQGIQWRTAEGPPLAGPTGAAGPAWVESVAFLADGTLLAGAEDQLWQVAPDRKATQVVKGVGGWVRFLAVDPTGRVAASASDDQSVRFWKRDGAGAWLVQGRTIALGRSVRALAVNARLDVAVGFIDGGVGVYREDGTRRWSTADHQGAVTSLAFLSDDDHLASGGADGVVRLYRLQTGHPPVTLRAEAGGVNALAWRPRAVELVAGYSKGRAIAWRVNVQELARAACEFAGRDLTEEEWNRFVGPSVPYERTCADARSDFPGQ